jgi:Cytochrome c7 and related cytochrome c
MPQIFHRSMNTISKVSIVGAILISVGCLVVLTALFRSSFAIRVNDPIEQPIPFSHKHHVSDDGIDCRYCHQSVETSSFADLPPTETCMTCHSQIWNQSPVLEPVRVSFQTGQPIQWNRVNDLPDYVYFNHSIHIAKGVGCETCHGRIDQMPLTYKAHTLYMAWCIDCHRHPEQYVRPKDQVFTMGYKPAVDQAILGPQLVKEYNIQSPSRLDDCYICHR